MSDENALGCLALVALVAVVAVVGGIRKCTKDSQDAADLENYREKIKSGWQPQELEWHKGGKLYNATVREWKSGSSHNRLATCGNWISAWEKEGQSVKRYQSLDEMKVDAEELKAAIDLGVLASDIHDDMTINRIATKMAFALKLVE